MQRESHVPWSNAVLGIAAVADTKSDSQRQAVANSQGARQIACFRRLAIVRFQGQTIVIEVATVPVVNLDTMDEDVDMRERFILAARFGTRGPDCLDGRIFEYLEDRSRIRGDFGVSVELQGFDPCGQRPFQGFSMLVEGHLESAGR